MTDLEAQSASGRHCPLLGGLLGGRTWVVGRPDRSRDCTLMLPPSLGRAEWLAAALPGCATRVKPSGNALRQLKRAGGAAGQAEGLGGDFSILVEGLILAL